MGEALPVAAYTVKQFCGAFGVGHTFVYAEIAAGRLRVRKAGRRTLVMRADAERWAAGLPEKNNPKSGSS